MLFFRNTIISSLNHDSVELYLWIPFILVCSLTLSVVLNIWNEGIQWWSYEPQPTYRFIDSFFSSHHTEQTNEIPKRLHVLRAIHMQSWHAQFISHSSMNVMLSYVMLPTFFFKMLDTFSKTPDIFSKYTFAPAIFNRYDRINSLFTAQFVVLIS